MILKKFTLLILIFIILLSFTGCYNTTGIDRQYFVVSFGIDLVENSLIKFSLQIPSSSSGSSESSSSAQASSYQLYSVEGETIDECISILNNYLNKKLNFSHCSALILSEEIAKKGIEPFINTLTNNTELRHSCEIIISSSTALDVLEKVANSGEVFSARLFDYLSTSAQYTGYTIQSTFGDFFQALDNDYYSPSCIYASVNNDTVQTNGIAIFNNSIMIGHIDVSNSISHLIVTNDLDTCTITIDNPFEENEKLDLDVSLYKNTEIKIDIINGSPLITLTVYPEGTIRSSGSIFNYIDNNNITSVEQATTNYLEKILKDYLYTISKKYNSDIVGFKGIYQSTFPTKEEFDKIHWDEIFQDSYFKINLKTKINSSNLFNKE